MVKKILLLLPFIVWSVHGVSGQGLFEESLAGDQNRNWTLSGYVRGLAWMGNQVAGDAFGAKAVYSEGEMSFLTHAGTRGDGKLAIRIRKTLVEGYEKEGIDLREAYVNLRLGPFSVKTGNQIVVWGRADSNNPTNLITPQNPLFHSPDIDDMRMGNFMVNTKISLTPQLFLQGIWIPVYRPSVLPLTEDILPPGMELPEVTLPGKSFANSNYAIKLDATFSSLDGSVSFFDGFDPFPLFALNGYQTLDSVVVPLVKAAPFREKVVGIDFSATLGTFGIRGEMAYRITPEDDPAALSDLRWVIGVDKTIGTLTLITQYAAYMVQDYHELTAPGDLSITPENLLLYYNRLIFRQDKKYQHAVSLHTTWAPGQGMTTFDGYGEYNLTTGESLVRLQVEWKVADALGLTGGWQWFRGDVNTLYDIVAPVLNGIYLQGKIFF